MSQLNPLFDPKTDNQPIDSQVQSEIINDPKADPQGIAKADQDFLINVMTKIDQGVINLHSPSTLLNQSLYEKLDEEKQGKADFNAVNLLSVLRQIYDLWKIDKKESFQISNLVNQVRMTKERLESELGDVYII